MSEIVKIIVPSYRRPNGVHAFGAVANAALCVTESEETAYRRNYPDAEILVHPDSVYGYSPTAQWILDRHPDCFLLDDDTARLTRKYIETGDTRSTNIDRDTAYELVQSTAQMAQEMGAYTFGFSTVPNPVTYHGFTAYRYTGFIVGGACGYLKGGGLFFDCAYTAVSDYWISLYNAWKNRFCLVDERFCWVDIGGTFKNRGGCANQRTVDTERLDYERLRAQFGEAIELKQHVETIRKAVNPYERTIKLPY